VNKYVKQFENVQQLQREARLIPMFIRLDIGSSQKLISRERERALTLHMPIVVNAVST
jgi:hypothetical protein